MIESLKSRDEYLMGQSKEQLIIFIKNLELIESGLRDKLFLITGCRSFGGCDGTDGSCVECSENNSRQWERCYLFEIAYRRYRSRED